MFQIKSSPKYKKNDPALGSKTPPMVWQMLLFMMLLMTKPSVRNAPFLLSPCPIDTARGIPLYSVQISF